MPSSMFHLASCAKQAQLEPHGTESLFQIARTSVQIANKFTTLMEACPGHAERYTDLGETPEVDARQSTPRLLASAPSSTRVMAARFWAVSVDTNIGRNSNPLDNVVV